MSSTCFAELDVLNKEPDVGTVFWKRYTGVNSVYFHLDYLHPVTEAKRFNKALIGQSKFAAKG